MKTKFKVLAALLLLSPLSAAAQGIEFYDGGFDAALNKATQENKVLFIDFYADWCGPCKRMVAEVFPDKTLGEYFRDRIVSIQLDTEAEENKHLVKRFNIKSIPTLVFLDAGNKVLSQTEGALPAEGLLRQARIAVGDSPEFTKLYSKYQSSKNDLELGQQVLQDAAGYLNTLEGIEYDKWLVRLERVFKEYSRKKLGPDMINAQDYSIIYSFEPEPEAGNEIAEFIVANIQQFIDNVGNGPAYYVMDYNTRTISQLAQAGKLDYKKWLDRIEGDMAPAYSIISAGHISPKERNSYLFDAEYLLFAKKDTKGYVELTDKYLTALGDDATANSYGEAAQKIYYATGGKMDDSVKLKTKEWTIKALQFEGTPLLDKINLLAMLGDTHRELGEYGEARKCYNQAYLESYQLSTAQMQMMVQMTVNRKLAQLELLEK